MQVRTFYTLWGLFVELISCWAGCRDHGGVCRLAWGTGVLGVFVFCYLEVLFVVSDVHVVVGGTVCFVGSVLVCCGVCSLCVFG